MTTVVANSRSGRRLRAETIIKVSDDFGNLIRQAAADENSRFQGSSTLF